MSLFDTPLEPLLPSTERLIIARDSHVCSKKMELSLYSGCSLNPMPTNFECPI
jgi:hypothetical protein